MFEARRTFDIEERSTVGFAMRAMRRRFLSKVVIAENGCWLWQGKGRSGRRKNYGTFSVDNRPHLAHRVGYELFVGPIPEGLQIDHYECDTPLCVNPEHLRPATPRQNTLRSLGPSAVNARKTHCIHGHEFTPTNTRRRSNGSRACRQCAADKALASYHAGLSAGRTHGLASTYKAGCRCVLCGAAGRLARQEPLGG